MARNNTREGRRRRVLNEEVLSANSSTRAQQAVRDLEPGDTPRYGAGANIENHPQVTAFVPRRFRTLSKIALIGVGTAATAELATHFAQPLSEFFGGISSAEITTAFGDRLVAWTSAAVLLLTVAYTRLVFSLRRHRVDDVRGRYRLWRTAGWLATIASLNAVVGGHTLVARVMGNWVDYQVLPAHAGWWLFPAALVGGAMLLRLAVDAAECRGALISFALALGCLAVAGIGAAGWSPAWASGFPGLLGRALPLVGYTFALVGTLLFARYVILDVQGLIEHETPTLAMNRSTAEPASTSAEETVVEAVEEVADDPETSAWIDGSEPEWIDDEDERSLSKAQRKRLRKQKQRRAA